MELSFEFKLVLLMNFAITFWIFYFFYFLTTTIRMFLKEKKKSVETFDFKKSESFFIAKRRMKILVLISLVIACILYYGRANVNQMKFLVR